MAQFTLHDGITEGTSWVLDLGTLKISEALELKRYAGLAPVAWVDALAEDDPLAVRFAFYLARTRAGEDIAIGDVEVDLFAMRLERIDEDDDATNTADGITEDTAGVVPTGQPMEASAAAQT